MSNTAKKLLMSAVVSGTLKDVQSTYFKNNIVFHNERYFDYKLLQAALARKDRSIIIFLIEEIGCRPHNQNDKNDNGEAPLHTAFKEKHLDAVRLLLDNCCKFNCVPKNKVDLLHSFHIACVTNHSLAAEHYLKCGVDPNKPLALDSAEYSGLNPVHFAAENNYYELFEKLICHGGDLSIKNAKGFTPLHILYYSSPTKERISQIKQAFKNGNETKFINSVDNNRLSHFHLCCMTNEPDFVQRFIDNGANVNSSILMKCKIDPGFTPLHFAVINVCEKVVQLLLKNGADCNKKDKEGKTPLHLACKTSGYWKLQIMKMLIDYKASPVIIDKDGNTPLHMEFYFVNREKMKFHISSSITIHVEFISSNSVIINSLSTNITQLVNDFDMLLSKISQNVNITNNEGLSYFHIACATNDITQVNDFLNAGVQVDCSVTSGIYSGYTALHFAALHNRKDVVQLLLKKNAQVNVKTTEFQFTPLHLACEFNYMKFYEGNAKYNLRSFKALPLNFQSTRNRQLDIIRLLLLHGAHVETKDSLGITPLLHTTMTASKFGATCNFLSYLYEEIFPEKINSRMEEITEILLYKKANVKACTNTQQTILHIFAKCKTLKVTENFIKLILTKGADIDAADVAGLTPLHVAVECRHKNLIQILLKYKANVNAKCKNFKIPLQLLIENSLQGPDEREIFCALLENDSNVNFNCKKVIVNKLQLYHPFDDEYKFIIKKLLYYGADVNVEDSLVNSCFSTLLEWGREGLNCLFSIEKFEILFQVCFIHVQKLLALELPVCEKVQKCCSELYAYHKDCSDRYFFQNVDNIFDDCIEELEKMKLIKIDNYTTLYNILRKDSRDLSKHVKNSSLIEIVKSENVHVNFPLYSSLLKLQFRRGSIRSEILESAKASLSYVSKLELPDLVFDSIMKYLTNEEIANLNSAVALKSYLKRKLNDDANLDESAPKMQNTRSKSLKNEKLIKNSDYSHLSYFI